MKTPLFSLKGFGFFTLLAGGYATAGYVFNANQPVTAQQSPQYPHGLSYGEVWQITRVIGPDILIEE
jgi:hypothetical protein